jgi:hypothetical protein
MWNWVRETELAGSGRAMSRHFNYCAVSHTLMGSYQLGSLSHASVCEASLRRIGCRLTGCFNNGHCLCLRQMAVVVGVRNIVVYSDDYSVWIRDIFNTTRVCLDLHPCLTSSVVRALNCILKVKGSSPTVTANLKNNKLSVKWQTNHT